MRCRRSRRARSSGRGSPPRPELRVERQREGRTMTRFDFSRRWSIAAAAAFLVLALGGTATAIVLRGGDLIIHAEGSFSPTTLPKHDNAPITLQGGGELSTASGDLPPVLKTLSIEYDRHGSVETRGLPVCTSGKLQATNTKAARRACPGAIVGTGFGRAIVAFPE